MRLEMASHRAVGSIFRVCTALLAAIFVSLVLSAAAQATPGDLDPAFSVDGKTTTDFGDFDVGLGVALQVNGKILAVGGATGAGGQDFSLARYNPNGSLDKSFSGNGKQRTDFGGAEAARGVALQANGKIVVVGGGAGGFALARYNPNGSLDKSFSGDGKKVTHFSSGAFDTAIGVAIQANGRLVAVGQVAGTGPYDFEFALARYNRDGSLDARFSSNGKQMTSFGGDDGATGVALQDNNKILAVGTHYGGGPSDFALARYNPDGSLDASFSANGKQTTRFGGDNGSVASGVALQEDNRIVVVGSGGGHRGRFGLARYNPDGSLDKSFSGNGRQTTDFVGSDASWARGVAIQADGRIVAVGGAGHPVGGGSDFALARYDPNGSLDPTFAGDGTKTTAFPRYDDLQGANGVALQDDGRIVAVGGRGDFALARYLGG